MTEHPKYARTGKLVVVLALRECVRVYVSLSEFTLVPIKALMLFK